jgi:chitinase
MIFILRFYRYKNGRIMMKIQKHIVAKLLIMALTLGMWGCSREKKNTEIENENVTPTAPTEKLATEITEVPENVDPLMNEVVIKPGVQDKGPRSIAYFTSWSAYDRALTVEDIDPTLLTHINFAFANLTEDGEVVVGDEEVDLKRDFGTELGGDVEDAFGHFGQLRQMKAKYPKLKVLISIGGWSWSTNFSDVAADPVKRDRFAASAAEFVSKYGMDGVDIDWEYPVEGGNNITHRTTDKENYRMLLKATRKALNEQGKADGKTYLLSIAARAAGRFILDSDLLESMQYLDFINLMTYDYHGSWENMTGLNAPLYDAGGNPSSIDATVTTFLKAGINAADINLGLAFYGRGWINVASTDNNGVNQAAEVPSDIGYGLGTWEAGAFDAWDIAENYADKNGYVRYYDETAQCPYVFDGTTWIGYDDEQSIKVKTEYAIEKGLGGVMFWDFAGDKNLKLQKTIAETLGIAKAE